MSARGRRWVAGWLRDRWPMLAMYGAIALLWWWLATYHDSPDGRSDGLDTAMQATIMATLGAYWLVTLVKRRDWPAQTLGLHALILGDAALYGLLVLGRERGWTPFSAETTGDLIRASVWVAGLILAFEVARWAWDGRPTRLRRRAR